MTDRTPSIPVPARPESASLSDKRLPVAQADNTPEAGRWTEVPELLATLYGVVDRLESLFPGRKFTLDGHLVGSIGEVIAAHMFDLTLLAGSSPGHDAAADDGRKVQIKLTQGTQRVALRAEPEHLLVLRLSRDRSIDVVYNGKGHTPWSNAGNPQKNGQRQISLARLRNIDASVAAPDRLPLFATSPFSLPSGTPPNPTTHSIAEPSLVTLNDALEDVRIAFLQVEFSIKLLSYCELGKIDPTEFDLDQIVLLEHENLRFPPGHFSDPDNMIRAANVTVLAALGASALILNKAWEVADIRPCPVSEDETIKLRTLVHMVRCAYAHGMADPKWQVKDRYRRQLEVKLPSGPLILDLRELDGQGFDFDALGGHAKWLEIRDESIARLTAAVDSPTGT